MNIADLFKPRGQQMGGGGFNLFPDAPWKQTPGVAGPLQNPNAVTMPPMQPAQDKLSRRDMAGLALMQIGNQYGPNRGQGGNDMMLQAVMQNRKERQAQNQRQQLIQQMKAAGYSDQDIVAVQFAPETAIKAIYEQKAPFTLNQGDARFGADGGMIANNPKFAYQNDTILQETPGGVQNMGRLDKSYSDIETERNNRQQNAIGWTNAQNSRDSWRPASDEDLATYGLPPGTSAQVNQDGKIQVLTKQRQYTEFAGKAAEYANRLYGAEPTLRKLETTPGFDVNSVWSGFAFNDNAKNYRIAMREWIAGMLRKDTGAAVTNQEFDLYGKTYFPVPGDGPQQIEAKRIARERAAQGVAAASQGAYQEWFGGQKPPQGSNLSNLSDEEILRALGQ